MVSPRVRRIAAHDPDSLSILEYFRQIFWSSGIDLPEEGLEAILDEVTIDAIELPAGEKAQMSLQLPAEFVIAFDPVTHAAHFIDVKGDRSRESNETFFVNLSDAVGALIVDGLGVGTIENDDRGWWW